MNIRQAVALQDVESLQNLLQDDSNLLRLSKRHSLARKAFSLLMRNKLYGDGDKTAEILLPSNSDNIPLYICLTLVILPRSYQDLGKRSMNQD